MANLPGSRVFSNPRGHDYQRDNAYRTWDQNLLDSTLIPEPESLSLRHGWGIPRGHQYQKDTAYREWAWSRNLGLYTEPAALNMRHRWGIPRGHDALLDSTALRSWTWARNVALYAPPAVPFSQEDWPLPRGPLQPDRFWAWSYNLNLIGKDRFPAGQEHYELPQRAYPYPQQTRTWTWSYNLNLIGQDQLPTGQIYDDRPLPINWYRDWSQNLLQTTLVAVAAPLNQYDWPLPQRVSLPAAPSWTFAYNLNLIGQDQLPTGEIVTDLAPRGYLQPDRFWSWSYNLNLIGKDRLPTGKIITELAPRGHLQPDRFWAWSYNLNLIAQDRFPPGTRVHDLPPRDFLRSPPSWAWWYNLNLIGQDRLPVGTIFDDRPPAIEWYRDWSLNLLQTTLTVTVTLPFNAYDWPLPRGNPPVTPAWTWWYNLNLIGRDQLPAGEIVTDRPPLGPLQPDRSWYWTYLRTLVGQDRLPTGKIITDLAPRGPLQPDRFWSWTYNLNLIGQDRFPAGQRHLELPPRDYQRSPPSWAWWYNLNLIAQDRLPTGEIITDRPPPLQWYRDWSQNLLQNTLSVAFTPFNQFDWPLPRDFQRVTPSWTAFYNVNLIGQDRLPVGEIITELAPRGPEFSTALRSWIGPRFLFFVPANLPFNTYDWPLPKVAVAGVDLRNWAYTYNPNLIGQDRLPPGRITTALTPIGVIYPASMYSFTSSPAVPPTPIVVTTDIHCLPIQATVGQLRSF